MKDPIERQDIIKELESWLKVEGYSEGELNIIKAVLYELQNIPSAQPGVINCKDCKHGVHAGCGNTYLCVVSPEERSEHIWDFWCAYAERRKNG